MPLENEYQRNRYGHMIQSPNFPTVDTAHRRLRQSRERIVARSLLGVGVGGALGLFAGVSLILGASVVALAIAGFIITCVVTGRRSLKDNGGHGKTSHRSF